MVLTDGLENLLGGCMGVMDGLETLCRRLGGSDRRSGNFCVGGWGGLTDGLETLCRRLRGSDGRSGNFV